MRHTHPFDPIADGASKVLILGSFPSIASFDAGFYYAHPRNRFWDIMADLFETPLDDTAARRAFLHEQRIALWDVYASLRRSEGNSSDANLADLVPNDIPGFLQEHPKITTLFCTGKKAYDGLLKAFPELKARTVLLPSTSPAHAAMRYEAKRDAYRAVKDALER